MEKLLNMLNSFNWRCAENEAKLTEEFKRIAGAVINGGYSIVNENAKIFVTDMEFYFHSERDEVETWKKDYAMYHRGPKDAVPYFPVGSVYPHNSGVDITFENESEEYRASFLIRGHQYVDEKETYSSDKPTYVRENMFGYANCLSGGLSIKWIDEASFVPSDIIQDVRINVSAYNKDGKLMAGVKDKRLWRFKVKMNSNDPRLPMQ